MCGLGDKSGPHTQQCPADMAATSVIGQEGLYMSECISELHAEQISLSHVTVDGDWKCRTLLENLEQPDKDIDIVVFYRVRHL